MAGARSSKSKGSQRPPHRGGTRSYPRTARINEVMREVIADELERIGDERLGLLTITGISVDPDLLHATVWVSALTVHGGVEAVSEALGEHRAQLQRAVGRQIRMKRTPLLQFKSDPAILAGQRIESIIRDLPPMAPDADDAESGDEHGQDEGQASHDEGMNSAE